MLYIQHEFSAVGVFGSLCCSMCIYYETTTNIYCIYICIFIRIYIYNFIYLYIVIHIYVYIYKEYICNYLYTKYNLLLNIVFICARFAQVLEEEVCCDSEN